MLQELPPRSCYFPIENTRKSSPSERKVILSRTWDMKIRWLTSTFRWKMMHAFMPQMCRAIVMRQKMGKLFSSSFENREKFDSLVNQSREKTAYKYHYPSSNNANYSSKPQHHPTTIFYPHPQPRKLFFFDNFTCFSHVNLNLVS